MGFLFSFSLISIIVWIIIIIFAILSFLLPYFVYKIYLNSFVLIKENQKHQLELQEKLTLVIKAINRISEKNIINKSQTQKNNKIDLLIE